MNIKIRLTLLNFLEFAVWGAYLTSMGTYLAGVGLGSHIGWFYSVQGIVSIFMPALMGILADRWMEGQRVLSLCHALAGIFMIAASIYGYKAGGAPEFSLHTFRSILHAHDSPQLFCCIFSFREGRTGYSQGFSSYSCLGNGWLYRHDVGCRPLRFAVKCRTMDGKRLPESCDVSLFPDNASDADKEGRA